MLSDSPTPGFAAVIKVVPTTIQILILSETFRKELLTLPSSSDPLFSVGAQSRRTARSRLPESAPKRAKRTIPSTANLGHAKSHASKLCVRYAPVTNTMTSEAMLAAASPGTGAVQGQISVGLDARLS